jgi:hypothetical protein
MINNLEAEKDHCFEELVVFRLSIWELEALILSALTQEGEDQKKKVKSTKTKKKSSSRGDSSNSRKNKLRQQGSDSSSEGDTRRGRRTHTCGSWTSRPRDHRAEHSPTGVQITPVIPGLPPSEIDPESRWHC